MNTLDLVGSGSGFLSEFGATTKGANAHERGKLFAPALRQVHPEHPNPNPNPGPNPNPNPNPKPSTPPSTLSLLGSRDTRRTLTRVSKVVVWAMSSLLGVVVTD